MIWDLENCKNKFNSLDLEHGLLSILHNEVMLTENYKRAIALNLDTCFYTMNEYIYSNYGIQGVEIEIKSDKVYFICNTDVLYILNDSLNNNYYLIILDMGNKCDLNHIFEWNQLLKTNIKFEPVILNNFISRNNISNVINNLSSITKLDDMILSLHAYYINQNINLGDLLLYINIKNITHVYLLCDYLEELVNFYDSLSLELVIPINHIKNINELDLIGVSPHTRDFSHE